MSYVIENNVTIPTGTNGRGRPLPTAFDLMFTVSGNTRRVSPKRAAHKDYDIMGIGSMTVANAFVLEHEHLGRHAKPVGNAIIKALKGRIADGKNPDLAQNAIDRMMHFSRYLTGAAPTAPVEVEAPTAPTAAQLGKMKKADLVAAFLALTTA